MKIQSQIYNTTNKCKKKQYTYKKDLRFTLVQQRLFIKLLVYIATGSQLCMHNGLNEIVQFHTSIIDHNTCFHSNKDFVNCQLLTTTAYSLVVFTITL